jgi:nitrite reductase (NAD(P)H)
MTFLFIQLILSFRFLTKRHADLFAKDVPPSKVIRIIDRFLAYYIMTADRLQRTARWIENMGIEVWRECILFDYPTISPKHP